METLTELVYCTLKEEEAQTAGWSKTTIDYVVKHKSKIYSSIRGIAKCQGKLLAMADVEDIYSNLIDYLYKTDDYNIEKAYNDNNIVSFEGYIHSCTKFCVKRYVTNMYKEERGKITENIIDDDGKEMSIFDSLPDKKGNSSFNDFGYDLSEICKCYESDRYSYGPDIFQLWFIRLLTIQYNKKDRYKDILEILGISKKDLNDMEQNIKIDGAMLSIAKAVSIDGIDNSINILRGYTYSSKRIEQVVELF